MKKKAVKKVTKEMIRRSVSSSTAIETNESVAELEKKLAKSSNQFPNIQLAI